MIKRNLKNNQKKTKTHYIQRNKNKDDNGFLIRNNPSYNIVEQHLYSTSEKNQFYI